MRVLRPGVHLELADEPAAQLVLGQHAPDGASHGLAVVITQQFTDGDSLETTGTSGMGIAHVIGALVAREGNLGSVDDDHEYPTSIKNRGGAAPECVPSPEL